MELFNFVNMKGSPLGCRVVVQFRWLLLVAKAERAVGHLLERVCDLCNAQEGQAEQSGERVQCVHIGPSLHVARGLFAGLGADADQVGEALDDDLAVVVTTGQAEATGGCARADQGKLSIGCFAGGA